MVPSSTLTESSSTSSSVIGTRNGKFLAVPVPITVTHLPDHVTLSMGSLCNGQGPTCKVPHLPRFATAVGPVVGTEGDQCLQVGHQLLWEKVGLWSRRESIKNTIWSVHNLVDIGILGNLVRVHVLQLRKFVQLCGRYCRKRRWKGCSTGHHDNNPWMYYMQCPFYCQRGHLNLHPCIEYCM